MPGMLGWFKMGATTTVEDIEWLMARSAGYDAGFAFVADLKAIKANGSSEQIFTILNNWETARLAGLFTEAQKELMRDTQTEFRLNKTPAGQLELTQIYSFKFAHEQKVRQPGEPLYSTFEFENKGKEQAADLIITAVEADLSSLVIELDSYRKIEVPGVLAKGQTLKITDGTAAKIYDASWKLVRELSLANLPLNLSAGKHSTILDCNFDKKGEKPTVKAELLLNAETQTIAAK